MKNLCFQSSATRFRCYTTPAKLAIQTGIEAERRSSKSRSPQYYHYETGDCQGTPWWDYNTLLRWVVLVNVCFRLKKLCTTSKDALYFRVPCCEPGEEDGGSRQFRWFRQTLKGSLVALDHLPNQILTGHLRSYFKEYVSQDLEETKV